MGIFVNRENELKMIEGACDALVDETRLLRTPVLNFYGIRGIGKTALLRKIGHFCDDRHLAWIWVNVDQGVPGFLQEIVNHVKKYHVPLPLLSEEETDWFSQSVFVTRTLLQQRPVVLLLDAVETSESDQLRWLEKFLCEICVNDKLFVILASTRAVSFQQERSVARKLTYWPLKPLNRQSCDAYLNREASLFEPGVCNFLFEWTHGYPLALRALTEAMNAGLDPRRAEDQKHLLVVLTRRVLDQNVFVNVKAEKREEYQIILRLLSVPRRFNIGILRDLIEGFALELKRESSLAYYSVPKEIDASTEVLEWSRVRVGYTVDPSIRTLFLLQMKREEPEMYDAIHRFLAETNQRLAQVVSGSDRNRYVRESFYHAACSEQVENVVQRLTETVQYLTEEPLASFSMFYEEFLQDQELQEVLGLHAPFVQVLLQKHWVKINH